MALSPSQLQTLKTFIQNDATLNAFPNNGDGNFAIATAMNVLAAPAWVVWRTAVPVQQILANIVWTELIGRSVGERDALQFMLQMGAINAADPNIRSGIGDIFSGTTGATTRTQLLALSKRNATVAEKLFSTGAGTTATPAIMGVEGALTYQDVGDARALP
jgi:hypothetical protein